MTTLRPEDVIAAIPQWDESQREQVRMMLGQFDSGSSTDGPASMLWATFESVSEDRGLTLPPFVRVRKSKGFRNFRQDAERVLQFVDNHIRPRNKTETVQGLRLCARGGPILPRRVGNTTFDHGHRSAVSERPGFGGARVAG